MRNITTKQLYTAVAKHLAIKTSFHLMTTPDKRLIPTDDNIIGNYFPAITPPVFELSVLTDEEMVVSLKISVRSFQIDAALPQVEFPVPKMTSVAALFQKMGEKFRLALDAFYLLSSDGIIVDSGSTNSLEEFFPASALVAEFDLFLNADTRVQINGGKYFGFSPDTLILELRRILRPLFGAVEFFVEKKLVMEIPKENEKLEYFWLERGASVPKAGGVLNLEAVPLDTIIEFKITIDGKDQLLLVKPEALFSDIIGSVINVKDIDIYKIEDASGEQITLDSAEWNLRAPEYADFMREAISGMTQMHISIKRKAVTKIRHIWYEGNSIGVEFPDGCEITKEIILEQVQTQCLRDPPLSSATHSLHTIDGHVLDESSLIEEWNKDRALGVNSKNDEISIIIKFGEAQELTIHFLRFMNGEELSNFLKKGSMLNDSHVLLCSNDIALDKSLRLSQSMGESDPILHLRIVSNTDVITKTVNYSDMNAIISGLATVQLATVVNWAKTIFKLGESLDVSYLVDQGNELPLEASLSDVEGDVIVIPGENKE